MSDSALEKISQVKDEIVSYVDCTIDDNDPDKEDLIQDGMLKAVEIYQHKRYLAYTPLYIFSNYIKPYIDSKHSVYEKRRYIDTEFICYYDSYDLNIDSDCIELIKIGVNHHSHNPERDIKVVSSFFGFDDGKKKTLEEVSNLFGITRARVTQIVSRSIHYLNYRYKNGSLDKYI